MKEIRNSMGGQKDLIYTMKLLVADFLNCIEPKSKELANMGHHLLGPTELAGNLIQGYPWQLLN
jgi:hypothetical protein